MRFRVTFSKTGDMHCATLEERDDYPGLGGDFWETVSDNHHLDGKEAALAGLKRRMVRDHEERMRAIEAAQ